MIKIRLKQATSIGRRGHVAAVDKRNPHKDTQIFKKRDREGILTVVTERFILVLDYNEGNLKEKGMQEAEPNILSESDFLTKVVPFFEDIKSQLQSILGKKRAWKTFLSKLSLVYINNFAMG